MVAILNPALFIQVLLNGLAIGMLYVLIVIGIDLILRTTRIVNFAHGQFYMIGAYAYYYSVAILHLNWILSLILAVAVSGLLGLLSYLSVFNFVQKRFLRGGAFSVRLLASTMASVGLMMILQQAVLNVFGTTEKAAPPVFPQIIHFAGVRFPAEKLAVVFAAWILCGCLYLFLYKTKLGKGMRAVSYDAEAASLQGVNIFRIYLISFMIGCGLAGIAGGIIAPVFAVTPVMGTEIIFVAFMVMLVGGIGTYKGAILGGIVIGLAFSFGFQLLGGVAMMYVFVVVLMIIILRPGGLLGEVLE